MVLGRRASRGAFERDASLSPEEADWEFEDRNARERGAEFRCFFFFPFDFGGRPVRCLTVHNFRRRKTKKTSLFIALSLFRFLNRFFAHRRLSERLPKPHLSTFFNARERERERLITPTCSSSEKKRQKDTDARPSAPRREKASKPFEAPVVAPPFFSPSRSKVRKTEAGPRAAEQPGKEKRRSQALS